MRTADSRTLSRRALFPTAGVAPLSLIAQPPSRPNILWIVAEDMSLDLRR